MSSQAPMTSQASTSPPVFGIITAVLVAASSVSVLSTDLYIPSLPDLVTIFATDVPTAQLTMSLNLTAFAIAQLIHGPLSDRFGRRPVLLWALITFALASLGCVFASSIARLSPTGNRPISRPITKK